MPCGGDAGSYARHWILPVQELGYPIVGNEKYEKSMRFWAGIFKKELDISELRSLEHSNFSGYFKYCKYATSLRATSPLRSINIQFDYQPILSLAQ
jgi:hypothetical protein